MDMPTHTQSPQTHVLPQNPRRFGGVGARMLKALCIALLAFGFSLILAQPFSFSVGTLMSSPDSRDFNMTDFYNIIADSRPVRSYDDKVVIIDIERTSRDDVTDVLELLSVMEPAAVGLDVTFNEPHEDDSRLLAAIDNCPNLVMAVGVGALPGSRDTFLVDDYSFFYDPRSPHTYGAVNLPTKSARGTIREFPLSFPGQFGKPIPSFAVAVAEKADADAVAALRERGNKTETIDFPSRTFDVIPWQELPDHPEMVKDRVVLVGAMHEFGDVHRTPLSEEMSGVMIHAHAVSTILRGNYYTRAAQWVNLGLAFLLCFLLALANLSLRVQIKGLVLRVVQVLVLYLIIRVGYSLFVDRRLIMDFSFSLLMLTFALFACDVWIGLSYIISGVIGRFRQKTHNTN